MSSSTDYPVIIHPLYYCWEWTGSFDKAGYGIQWKPRIIRAHTLVWIAHHQRSVRPGFVLDHNCQNRACCSPFHLQEVTQHENMLRQGRSGQAYRARLKLCQFGHSLDDRIITEWSGFACRTCKAGPQH